MVYKSPIEIIQGELKLEMEGAIMRAVQKHDIVVDKHELLQALQYDRQQYEKGYQDAMPKWIPVTERLPGFDIERVLVVIKGDYILGYPKMDTDRYQNHMWVRYGDNVTHWMPLPEPPEEGG